MKREVYDLSVGADPFVETGWEFRHRDIASGAIALEESLTRSARGHTVPFEHEVINKTAQGFALSLEHPRIAAAACATVVFLGAAVGYGIARYVGHQRQQSAL